jgi:Helix-turn-helix domain
MDRDQLEAWLEEGLSLPQIGALVGRNPSTVGYWVRKYGLVANGREKYAPQGGVDEEVLEILCDEGATLGEMADELGRSISTICYWLNRYGLQTEGGRSAAERHELRQALKDGRRTVILSCKRHGETDFALVGSQRQPRCKRCRAEAVARRRRKVKRILVEEAGGRCQMCGYDKSFAALEFHHLDPTKKAFGVARRGITRSIEKVREEVRKCILICSNCHAEVEAGVKAVPVELKEAALPR